ANDPTVQGIIIEVNTGGGEVTAAQMLKSAITYAVAKKPVITWGHFSASGGVLGTLPSSEIIASDTYAEFVSVGVYTAIDKEFAAWYREYVDQIYSEKSTDKNKDWRDYLEGDKSLFQKGVNELDDMFMADVKKHRPLKGNVKETLAGGMFLAKDAKARGLIDGIGGIDYVMSRMKWPIKDR